MFRPLVSQYPISLRPNGRFFRARKRYMNSQDRPCILNCRNFKTIYNQEEA
ncbi:hypothetical protein Hanom_Chr05g00445031 [Helianthus anomalus]